VTVRLFISYRREDSAGQAGRLYDRVAERYSRDAVFMDVARIEPGADFAETIANAVGLCNVMLAVIGRGWLGRERSGRRRIEDPDDFVRLEIVAGLNRKIPVVPVLVDGAPMPASESLPPELAELTRTPAVELQEKSWDEDVRRLIAMLEQVAQPARGHAPRGVTSSSRTRLALTVATIVLTVTAAIMFLPVGRRTSPAAVAARTSVSVTPAASMRARVTRALAVLPDQHVAAASAGGIAVWNVATATSSPIVADADDDAMSLVVLSAGRLAWGTRSGGIKVWDLKKSELQVTLAGHTGAVVALAAMNGERLASGSWDGTVRVWNLATGKLERTLTGHTRQVRALAALGHARLASGSTDGTIIVWNLEGETERFRTLNRQGSAINALARVDDERLAAGSEDGTIEIWNCGTGDREANVRAHQDWINGLAVLSDGRVASASDDRTVAVWNPLKRDLDARLEGHNDRVNAVAVLPDGRLVSGSEDGTIRLWVAGRR
jgi:TIR domain-containing protein/WD40 domain-containing protein